jgi:hypothetical protein
MIKPKRLQCAEPCPTLVIVGDVKEHKLVNPCCIKPKGHLFEHITSARLNSIKWRTAIGTDTGERLG